MFPLCDMAEAVKVDVYPRELVPGELDALGGVLAAILSEPDEISG